MRTIFSILVLALSMQMHAQTLEEYLQIAAENNAGLKAQFFSYQASLEQIDQVGNLPDPEFSFGYFISPVETRVGAQEARISLMQMFPWFKTLDAQRAVKAEVAKADYEAFEQMKKELFFKIESTYYILYELGERQAIVKRHIDILESLERVAVQRFETGQASMVDVLRVQIEIAELKNAHQHLIEKEVPLQSKFNALLNREQDIEISIPDSLLSSELLLGKQALMDSILSGNHQLKQLEYLMSAKVNSSVVAKKQGSPTVGVGLNYTVVSERSDVAIPDNGKDAFMPMLTLSLPIYRGRVKAGLREIDFQKEAIEQMTVEQRNVLETNLESAWLDYIDAGRRLELYRQQLRTARQAQNIMTQAYGTNGKEFEEVLRIQRLILDYDMKVIEAIKDRKTAVAEIDSLM